MQLSAPVVVHEPAPPLAVTVYPVIELPPLLAGADHETVACAPGTLVPTAETAVGAPATPSGVTALDGLDGAPVPLALVAVTVKV